MEHKPIDDFDIQALVDAQLGWEDEKRVWMAVQSNPQYLQRYQQLVNQKKALSLWWSAENDLSQRSFDKQDS